MTSIDRFFDGTRYALVGTDPHTPYGASLVNALRAGGRQVYAVFSAGTSAATAAKGTTAAPAGEPVETFGSLSEVPGRLDGVILNIERDPQRMLAEVQTAVALGIPRVWIENRCEAAEAVTYALAHGVEVVDNVCPLLVLDPRHIHWIHRKVLDVFGKTPQVQHQQSAA